MGPENSVPAIGCDGIKKTLFGKLILTSFITEAFVEPVSVIIAFAFKWGDINLATVSIEPTGIARMTNSASFTASEILSHTKDAIPISDTIFLCSGSIS